MSGISFDRSQNRKIGAILQYVQLAASTLISFAYTPYMLSKLGKAEYGLYNLSNSIISYLSLLTMGMQSSYIRFYARAKCQDDKEETDGKIASLNGHYLLIFFVIMLVALGAGLILSFNANIFFNETYTDEQKDIARILFILMTVNLAVSFPMSVFSSYISAHERFIFLQSVNIIKSVLSPLSMVLVLALGYKSIGMVVVTLTLSLLVDAINIFYSFHKLKMRLSFKGFDFHLLKEIFVFSFFIAINQLIDQVNWQADKVILGKVVTAEAVAVYGVGSQINTYYITFGTAISSVFVPKVNGIVYSGRPQEEIDKSLSDLMIKVAKIVYPLIMLVFTGFVFFGKYFVLRWAGEGYSDAYYIIILLIAPITVDVIQHLGIEIQRAENKHQSRSIIYLIGAAFNITISIFMAMKWGAIGAAAGTTITIFLFNDFAMNIIYAKQLHLDIGRFWIEILRISVGLLIPVACGIPLLLFYEFHGLWDFALLIVAYTAIYCVSMYFTGMSHFERDSLKAAVKRALDKRKANADSKGDTK